MTTINTDPYITIANLSAMLLDMTESLNAANALLDSQELDIDKLSEQNNQLQYDLNNAEFDLARLNDSGQAWARKVEELKADLDIARDRSAVEREELVQCRSNYVLVQETIDGLNRTIETMKIDMDEDAKNHEVAISCFEEEARSYQANINRLEQENAELKLDIQALNDQKWEITCPV
jgi:chromosome segregation ATPase